MRSGNRTQDLLHQGRALTDCPRSSSYLCFPLILPTLHPPIFPLLSYYSTGTTHITATTATTGTTGTTATTGTTGTTGTTATTATTATTGTSLLVRYKIIF